nr:hypothetical protein MedDCM-OCT-S15-C1-cds38 [uncultured Mediterranean phage MEDS1 group]BAR22046.1 putative phage tail protein [uncultured Mediterranean phage uvMED]BAR22051.1 putative phage tail protein [uncultured Mediterranean phage uvMED]BAR22121.1 putative phage tail protein [uncultured Mediterranean phage uvMED]BAR39016.1 putative phage tail protein [uncultured Mediterranean phage uvMED]
MARNDLKKFLKDFDRVTNDVAFNAPMEAANTVVNKLKDIGPSWTGRFNNSWNIDTPIKSLNTKGKKSRGEAVPLKIRVLKSRQNAKKLRASNEAVFIIHNVASYAMQAIDVANFTPLKPPPKVTSKRTQTGFRESGLRGLDVVSSEPGANARQTAPLDWFKTYSNGGAMNKDAKIGYNKIYRRVK